MSNTSGLKQMVENFKKNAVIMEFVTSEALEKVASEIRIKCGGGTTAKAVEILRITDKSVEERVQKYIGAGLVGATLAGLGL